MKNGLAEDILGGKRGAAGNCAYEAEGMNTSHMSKRTQETAFTRKKK
jgi:hypothetical protein